MITARASAGWLRRTRFHRAVVRGLQRVRVAGADEGDDRAGERDPVGARESRVPVREHGRQQTGRHQRERAGDHHHRPGGGDVAAGPPRIAGDVEANRGRLARLADQQEHAEPGDDRGVLAAHGGSHRPGDDDAAQRRRCRRGDVEAGRPGDRAADMGLAQERRGPRPAARRGCGCSTVRGVLRGRACWPLVRGLTAAKVRFWVTMCPRTAPVSTASASLNSPLTGFQSVALTALAAPCAGGGQPITARAPNPRPPRAAARCAPCTRSRG